MKLTRNETIAMACKDRECNVCTIDCIEESMGAYKVIATGPAQEILSPSTGTVGVDFTKVLAFWFYAMKCKRLTKEDALLLFSREAK
jgi:hypothetical protein